MLLVMTALFLFLLRHPLSPPPQPQSPVRTLSSHPLPCPCRRSPRRHPRLSRARPALLDPATLAGARRRPHMAAAHRAGIAGDLGALRACVRRGRLINLDLHVKFLFAQLSPPSSDASPLCSLCRSTPRRRGAAPSPSLRPPAPLVRCRSNGAPWSSLKPRPTGSPQEHSAAPPSHPHKKCSTFCLSRFRPRFRRCGIGSVQLGHNRLQSYPPHDQAIDAASKSAPSPVCLDQPALTCFASLRQPRRLRPRHLLSAQELSRRSRGIA
jgi:hypothetical protein